MWFLDKIFTPQNKTERAKIQGYTFWWAYIDYNLSFDLFYKFYNFNPFVFSVINKRSNDVGARWFELRKWENDEITYNDEFQEIIKDSTSQTIKEFIKRLVRDYDVTWNAFIYVIRDEWWTPNWLQILDPRYIKPVAKSDGRVIWYIQNLDWIRAFLPDEVFHLKDDNDIINEIMGKSRMTSLFLDVESDNEARESNLAFFRNNQTPSSIVILDPDFEFDINDETLQRQKIKEMFEWWRFQGGKNKHRSLVFQWIKDVIKIQDKISDMEFLKLRQFTLDVVAAIYEVPKSILWFTETTNYSNWLTQYDIYYDTIESLEEKVWNFLTKILKLFDEQYEFVFLKDNLRKLNTKAEIAGKLYKTDQIITLNEARDIMQYEPLEWWDTVYQTKTIWVQTTDENENQKK